MKVTENNNDFILLSIAAVTKKKDLTSGYIAKKV